MERFEPVGVRGENSKYAFVISERGRGINKGCWNEESLNRA